MDFVEICNVCTRKVIIKAAKRIFNSDKICCSYYDFYFGITFLEHCITIVGGRALKLHRQLDCQLAVLVHLTMQMSQPETKNVKRT